MPPPFAPVDSQNSATGEAAGEPTTDAAPAHEAEPPVTAGTPPDAAAKEKEVAALKVRVAKEKADKLLAAKQALAFHARQTSKRRRNMPPPSRRSPSMRISSRCRWSTPKPSCPCRSQRRSRPSPCRRPKPTRSCHSRSLRRRPNLPFRRMRRGRSSTL